MKNTDTDIISSFARVLIDTGAKHIYIVTSNDGISIFEFEDLQSKMLQLDPSIALYRLLAHTHLRPESLAI